MPGQLIPIRFYMLVIRQADAVAKLGADTPALRHLGGQAEGGLIRWSAMSLGDINDQIKKLVRHGFRRPRKSADDMALLDMNRGLLAPCSWLDVTTADGARYVALKAPEDLQTVVTPAQAGLQALEDDRASRLLEAEESRRRRRSGPGIFHGFLEEDED